MYIAHPTHGAGTQPNRTQPPTAARKTTLNAGQCVRQPREGRGRNRQPPPPKQKKNNRGGRGGGRENSPQPPNCPPTPPEAAKPPPRRRRKRDPKKKRHKGTTQPKPATPSQEQRPTGRKDTEKCRHTPRKRKKRASSPARKKGDGGTGTTRPAIETPKKNQKKAQKTHPDNPAKKGGAQPRPGRSTHAHTARRNRKPRGASGARTKPQTSHKQAKTKPQPRTPQTADTGGTTPQTVPKHTHPRRLPGLAGLTTPAPNRKPDPNTNAAQQ